MRRDRAEMVPRWCRDRPNSTLLSPTLPNHFSGHEQRVNERHTQALDACAAADALLKPYLTHSNDDDDESTALHDARDLYSKARRFVNLGEFFC